MKTIIKKATGEVHFQHRVWMNEINFYTEDLKVFQGKLQEVAAKNTSKDCHIEVEQFQNKFIIQKNELDEIEHLIHINEDEAVRTGKSHIRRMDYESTKEFIDIENRMVQFEKLYKELKTDFFRFLSKWM